MSTHTSKRHVRCLPGSVHTFTCLELNSVDFSFSCANICFSINHVSFFNWSCFEHPRKIIFSLNVLMEKCFIKEALFFQIARHAEYKLYWANSTVVPSRQQNRLLSISDINLTCMLRLFCNFCTTLTIPARLLGAKCHVFHLFQQSGRFALEAPRSVRNSWVKSPSPQHIAS